MRGTLRITWPLLSLSICLFSGVLSDPAIQQNSTLTTVMNTVTVSHVSSIVQASTAQSIETPESKSTTNILLVKLATVHKDGSTEHSATTATPSTTVATVPTTQPTPSVSVLTTSTSPSVGLNNPVTTVSSTTPEVKTTTKVVNQPAVPPSTATTVPDSRVQSTTVKTSGASGVSTEKPGQLGTKETPTTSLTGLSSGSDTQTTPLTRMDDRNIGTTKFATTKIGVTPSGTSIPKVTTGRPSASSLPPPAAKSSEAPTTVRPKESIVSMATGQKTIKYSLGDPKTKENKIVEDLCKKFMSLFKGGNCSVMLQDGKVLFDSLEITGYVKERLVMEEHEKLTKEPATTETDRGTLIAILASCGALLIMIITLGVCVSHRRKPYNETQQHLTEEMHTVENGYHDNPTLEVMEVQPEMQEKKVALNGEFGDSWIVPIDNLIKEDNPDEEDTHL